MSCRVLVTLGVAALLGGPAGALAAGIAAPPPPAVKRHCVVYRVARDHHGRRVARCAKYRTS